MKKGIWLFQSKSPLTTGLSILEMIVHLRARLNYDTLPATRKGSTDTKYVVGIGLEFWGWPAPARLIQFWPSQRALANQKSLLAYHCTVW